MHSSPFPHRSLRISLVFVAALLLSPLAAVTRAYGCSCAGDPPIETAYNNAQVILVGRIDHVGPSPLRRGQIEVKVAVQTWIKGRDVIENSKTNTVLLYTAKDEAQCGFSFFQEQDYIIFAKGTPANLRTDICSGTILLDTGIAQLDKLLKLSGQ